MAFWLYNGDDDEIFPTLGLTARPGYVYDLGSQTPPAEPLPLSGVNAHPATRWVADGGPATDFLVRQASDVLPDPATGSAGDVLAINDDGDGYELATPGGGGGAGLDLSIFISSNAFGMGGEYDGTAVALADLPSGTNAPFDTAYLGTDGSTSEAVASGATGVENAYVKVTNNGSGGVRVKQAGLYVLYPAVNFSAPLTESARLRVAHDERVVLAGANEADFRFVAPIAANTDLVLQIFADSADDAITVTYAALTLSPLIIA